MGIKWVSGEVDEDGDAKEKKLSMSCDCGYTERMRANTPDRKPTFDTKKQCQKRSNATDRPNTRIWSINFFWRSETISSWQMWLRPEIRVVLPLINWCGQKIHARTISMTTNIRLTETEDEWHTTKKPFTFGTTQSCDNVVVGALA